MSAIPFISYFAGDGSTTDFILDTSRDPYYISNDITLNAAEAIPSPSINYLSPAFDYKKRPSAVVQVAAKNALNNSDLSFSSASITGPDITFSLGSAPSSGVLVCIYGFIDF